MEGTTNWRVRAAERLAGWLKALRRSDGKRRGRRFDQSGMTLIEIMVVVAIMGLMLGTVGVVAFNKWKKAQVTNGKQIIVNMKNAIEHYAIGNPSESCPKELSGLVPEQIKKVPKDPWGSDLIYKCPGEQDTDTADISSKGPDRKEGTDDDINSWEL